MMELRVRILRSLDELASLEQFWRGAITPASGALYATYNFDAVYQWARQLMHLERRERRELFVLVACAAGSLVGVWPLMRVFYTRRSLVPYRRLQFLAHDRADYTDILIAPQTPREPILRAFAAKLQTLRRSWDETKLWLIPDDSPNLRILETLAADGILPHWTVSRTINHYILTKEQDWTSYLANRGRGIREDIRRRRRRLAEIGRTEVVFRDASYFERFDSSVDQIHIKRQNQLGRSSNFEVRAYSDYMRLLRKEFSKSGVLDYCILLLSGRVIAYMYGFLFGRVRYSWNVGFDPEFDRFAPGQVLLYEWVKNSFDDPEVTEFNFMRGDSDFKKKWADHHRFTNKITFESSSIYSRILRLARSVSKATTKIEDSGA